MAKVRQTRLERVNLILRTIRKVDQIILEEMDRDRLTRSVCDSLVTTRGYYNAWIVLLDDTGKFVTATEAGLGDAFPLLLEKLRREGPSRCGQQALTEPKAVMINDPASTCTDCPLSHKYMGRGGITARLYYRDKLYGLLCASVPRSLAEEEEERSLFEEIARDTAFALHKIGLEEEHKRAEEALKSSENRYRALFDSASDGMLVRHLDGSIIMANNAMAELTGYTVDELTRISVAQILKPDGFKVALEKQAAQIENRGSLPQRYELQIIRKDGTERATEVVTTLLDEEQTPIIQEIARDITVQKRAQDTLRVYAEQAMLAQEEERKRIARELHDETAQALASLGMDIGSLARDRKQNNKEISRSLEGLQKRAEDILRGVRILSHALRPPMLEEFGLLTALQGLLNEMTNQRQMSTRFDVEGTPQKLSPDIDIELYRIAQEALHNVWRHAEATECSLSVKYSPDMVRLEVRDNGRGFELSDTMADLAHQRKLGLTSMLERAKLIGGKLAIESQPGKGTTILVVVPSVNQTPPP